MTCLLSCSEDRLTVESKHLALKELLMKVLCGKMKGSQYIISERLKKGPIKIALQHKYVLNCISFSNETEMYKKAFFLSRVKPRWSYFYVFFVFVLYLIELRVSKLNKK